MAITSQRLRVIFRGLENSDGAAFFKQVADDVEWMVMGKHPLAGHYRSKTAFVEGTFAKLGQVLPQGAQLQVENLIVKDESGSGRASFSGDRQERHALRQSLLLGRVLPKME
jgi:uncharacterized protein